MGLKDIKALVVSKLGINIDDADENTFLNARINYAAEELYNNNDLIGCMQECILKVDTTTKQVALPNYIGHIRGIRWYEDVAPKGFQDIRPRYSEMGSSYLNSIKWRDKGRTPLALPIIHDARLTFTLIDVETEEVQITIIGKTETSHRAKETVAICAGQLSVSTSESFKEVYSIRKNKVTLHDIVVLDLEDRELAIIPANEKSVDYSLIQIYEDGTGGSSSMPDGVEVLYKARYIPMVFEEDEFQCGGYDLAIFFKVLEHYYTLQKGEDSIKEVVKMSLKVKELVRERGQNTSIGKEAPMLFGKNPFYGLFRRNYRYNIR